MLRQGVLFHRDHLRRKEIILGGKLFCNGQGATQLLLDGLDSHNVGILLHTVCLGLWLVIVIETSRLIELILLLLLLLVRLWILLLVLLKLHVILLQWLLVGQFCELLGAVKSGSLGAGLRLVGARIFLIFGLLLAGAILIEAGIGIRIVAILERVRRVLVSTPTPPRQPRLIADYFRRKPRKRRLFIRHHVTMSTVLG